MAQKGEDHSEILSQITFETLMELFFSGYHGKAFDELAKAFTQIQYYIGRVFGHLFACLFGFQLLFNLKTSRALALIRKQVNHVLEESLSQKRQSVLVDRLRLAKDPETGKSLSKSDIADEIITFFIAGHDTTALTLTYTSYLLANNPRVLRKLQAELDQLNSITSTELKNCLYLKATIDESMRLFPTAYMVNRSNKDWVKLGDYNFAPHTTFFSFPICPSSIRSLLERPRKIQT